MCPNTLAAVVTALAAALANGRCADEISLLGAIFSQLGDTLTTMAIQKELCEKCKKDAPA